MNCSVASAQRHAYVDGELAPAERLAFETHLAGCATCRAEIDALRGLLAGARALPVTADPARDLWAGIRSQLDAHRSELAALPPPPIPFRWFAPFAVAAAAALLVVLGEPAAPSLRSAWSVSAVAGTPRLDTVPLRHAVPTPLRRGQWLETDLASRATLDAERLGEIKVEPGTRVRLVAAAPSDQRLELGRGTLHALIWAPPRLFFVDTPAATAVDLGCAYTVRVDADGHGELVVTLGYVALESGDREALIPAGARCFTRKGAGPGLPFVDDASAALREAVRRFDAASASAPSAPVVLPLVEAVIAQARPADAITVWHLLGRTSGAARAAACDALLRLSPPPAGVTREAILRGDVPARRAWAEALGLGNFLRR